MQSFDRAWLYCILPRTHAVSDEFVDAASHSFAVGFGPLAEPVPPKPAASDAPATPAVPATPPPADSPAPATPETPATQNPPAPTRTTARIIVLPGFPGDGFDANLNSGSSLGLSPVGVYQKIFHAITFVDTTATPVRPLPAGLSQLWKISAADDRGRYHGFIARSVNGAAWSFGICYPGDNSEFLRDTLLRHLTLRLGQHLRFPATATDWRIDTAVPPGWTSPGPSKTSRRWNAPGPDAHAFLVITHGEPVTGGLFPQCSGADAFQRLRQLAELRNHAEPATRQESVFLPALWAPCGQAEVQLNTVPRATTAGCWLFYDPVARKKFCVYYGYQSAAEKAAIDSSLAQLSRVTADPDLPGLADLPGPSGAPETPGPVSPESPVIPKAPRP